MDTLKWCSEAAVGLMKTNKQKLNPDKMEALWMKFVPDFGNGILPVSDGEALL